MLAVDRGEQPGVDLLAAPVMAGARYARPTRVLLGRRRALRQPSAVARRSARRVVGVQRADIALRLRDDALHPGVASEPVEVSSVASVVQEHTCGRWTGCSAAESTRPRSTAPCSSKSSARAPELASQIRVIETFGPSPIPPLVVSRSLAADVREALRSTLLQMHVDRIGRRVLSRARINRFVGVADADYDPIRRMWRVAADLEPWTDGAAYAGVAR